MAKLIYFTPTSLDGFIANDGHYEWSAPDETVMAFINDILRPIGTFLCGRKNYETMTFWDTAELIPGLPPASLEFARIWQAADKIVYSKSLEAVSAPKTRLEREFDVDRVRGWNAELTHDVSISGPSLAAQAIRAGLVDEYRLLVMPMLIGGGNRVLPGGVKVKLELLEERRFTNGTVYLRYQTPK